MKTIGKIFLVLSILSILGAIQLIAMENSAEGSDVSIGSGTLTITSESATIKVNVPFTGKITRDLKDLDPIDDHLYAIKLYDSDILYGFVFTINSRMQIRPLVAVYSEDADSELVYWIYRDYKTPVKCNLSMLSCTRMVDAWLEQNNYDWVQY
jgi:hypothetical protein